MQNKQDKAVFEVLKYPYIHPEEEGPVPVGAKVDLGHLSINDRIKLVDRGMMKPLAPGALDIPGPKVNAPELPKLNKYGLPFGQVPKQTRSKEK